jgi:hypothetical protein
MGVQAAFTAWLQEQLHSGTDFSLDVKGKDVSLMSIERYEQGGIDAFTLSFNNGDEIQVAVGPYDS